MIFFVDNITPRLRYILDFAGHQLLNESTRVTSSAEEFRNTPGVKINYSDTRLDDESIWIKPQGLLHETGIREPDTTCFIVNNRKAFFKTEGDYPFDLFAAGFWLLSRYEEYRPHEKDSYGRYAHTNSLAFRERFLDQPLVNLWLLDFAHFLKTKFPSLSIHCPEFTLLPTYDIDMAWSYLHKGFWRNAGGWIRSLLKGDFAQMNERFRVLRGKQKDPFDCFGWLNRLHEQYQLKPYYFFLVPEIRGRYDKNIPPSCKAMQELIRDHVIRYPVGLHPSWRSGDDIPLLQKEIETLSRLTGSPVVSSRQHYIRFGLPGGYRRLADHGIRFDFSMGYGTINGFRASVASPFYWYDLEKETTTDLLLFPFCFMDANSFYEQRLTAEQALEEMKYYYDAVRQVNGYFIMIWHNPFLGTDPLYKGWKEIYLAFWERKVFAANT